jgi:ADP-ribose pyrophosphatase YjhB (NUDIX family)
MKKRREQISLGVRVIIIGGDKFLIMSQRKTNGREVCILTGGGIEASEDIFTAARREVFEECSINVKIQKLLYIKELFAPDLRSFEFYVLGKMLSGKLGIGYDPELPQDDQVLKQIIFMPINNLKNIRFYPQELRAKSAKDHKKRFKNITIHLGVQCFTPKQHKLRFGSK